MSEILTRRKLLWGAGGLAVAVWLPQLKTLAQRARPPLPLKPNAYIHVAANNTVTFQIVKGEMGQGISTALAQILADELDCDWERVRIEFAPVDPSSYGGMQGVFGSTSVRSMWIPMRKAGATARALLVQAAADEWHVDAGQIRTENGMVVGPAAEMRLSYGQLSEAAMRLPIPQNVALKNASEFKLIGRSVKRLDTRSKVCGAAKFWH